MGELPQRPAAMTMRAQEVGQDIAVAVSAHGQGSRVAGTGGALTEPADQLGPFLGRVRDEAAPPDRLGRIKHTDGRGGRRPVEGDEGHVLRPGCETLRGERSYRSLTDWQSRLAQLWGRRPVAGWDLSFRG